MSGLILLGFASVYREGVEVVLFLQSSGCRSARGWCCWRGGGAHFTLFVGVITFAAHHRLPYKKMLTLTGILLGRCFSS